MRNLAGLLGYVITSAEATPSPDEQFLAQVVAQQTGVAVSNAGRLVGLLATARTPSARTDNWLYTYGQVAGALTLAGRLVRLGTAVVRGMRPDVDVLRRSADDQFIGAADLAEDLAVGHGVDYRTTYRIVGHAVADAMARGAGQLTADGLDAAAAHITGAPLGNPPAAIGTYRQPATLVAGRGTPGAASPARVREHAHRVLEATARAGQWRAGREHAIEHAHAALTAVATELARR